ncbi:MAG: DUF167 domain-containing protein [Deltaproteobacteria bacterium]|jgi:uncharacterized protein YggU (UPF0235/DUF167 family)|nr:DUF167 domain-containing protein [Deltaproteobacteria bacterium]
MTENAPSFSRPAYVRKAAPSGWSLMVWVRPGAGRSECAGLREDRLRISLAAPAVDNRANEALTSFVAERLGLRPSRVRLASGGTGRRKRLVLEVEEAPDWTRLN